MTFDDFQKQSIIYHNDHKNWSRYGQSLFNYLFEIRPDIADELRGSESDPFHKDDDLTITRFWSFIKDKWK